mmetsp:Transcript_5454/g.9681  ORF Transcript_5454/g.9681 Transcript_5454/m.9681 type:complete len:235 (+) Transcript_5454:1159-1863(+)
MSLHPVGPIIIRMVRIVLALHTQPRAQLRDLLVGDLPALRGLEAILRLQLLLLFLVDFKGRLVHAAGALLNCLTGQDLGGLWGVILLLQPLNCCLPPLGLESCQSLGHLLTPLLRQDLARFILVVALHLKLQLRLMLLHRRRVQPVGHLFQLRRVQLLLRGAVRLLFGLQSGGFGSIVDGLGQPLHRSLVLPAALRLLLRAELRQAPGGLGPLGTVIGAAGCSCSSRAWVSFSR